MRWTVSTSLRFRYLVVVLGALTMPGLIAIAFVVGALTVLFDVTYVSYTPTVVGRWQIAVSARAATSTAQYDATAHERPYDVVSGSTSGTVLSVNLTMSATSGPTGNAVTLTATSTGSSTPRYRFRTRASGGLVESPCGDYAAAATCAWTPPRTR